MPGKVATMLKVVLTLAVLIAATCNSHAAPTDDSDGDATTTKAVNEAEMDNSRDRRAVLPSRKFCYYAST